MTAKASAKHNLTAGAIAAHLRRLAMPAATGLFCQTLYNITDTYYAGWLGTQAQAALSFAFPLYFVLLSCSVGLSQALTARAARALGAGKKSRASYFAAQGAMLSVFFGAAVGFFCLTQIDFALSLLGAGGKAREGAAEYITVFFFAAPVFLFMFALAGILQAAGDTVAYRNGVIASVVLNIALDPILMFGWFGMPALGVAGIAAATVASTAFSAAYLLWCASRTVFAFRWRAVFLFPRRKIFALLLAGSAAPTVRMLAIGAGFFITTAFLGVLDSDAVAAYGIAMRIEQLFLLPLIGMEIAMLSFAGQNFGAQKPSRVRDAMRFCDRAGFAFAALGAVVLAGGGALLMAAFNGEESVVAYGRGYLLAAAGAGPLYFILNVSGAVLLAGGKARAIFLSSVFRLLVFPPALFWFFALHLQWGASGIWLGVWLSQIAPALWLRRQSKLLLRNFADDDAAGKSVAALAQPATMAEPLAEIAAAAPAKNGGAQR